MTGTSFVSFLDEFIARIPQIPRYASSHTILIRLTLKPYIPWGSILYLLRKINSFPTAYSRIFFSHSYKYLCILVRLVSRLAIQNEKKCEPSSNSVRGRYVHFCTTALGEKYESISYLPCHINTCGAATTLRDYVVPDEIVFFQV